MQAVGPAQVKIAVAPLPWEDDCYLQPVVLDDPLLQLDFDLFSSDSNSACEVNLSAKLIEMQRQVAVYKETLAQAHEDLQSMR